jgi:hypothetical protein
MSKKFRVLNPAQMKELKALLLSLDAPTLSVVYSYIRGLIQVAKTDDRAKK